MEIICNKNTNYSININTDHARTHTRKSSSKCTHPPTKKSNYHITQQQAHPYVYNNNNNSYIEIKQ